MVEKYCKFHDKMCSWTAKGTTCTERREEMRLRNYDATKIPGTYCCKGCKKTLPSSQFHKQKSKLGIKTFCKSCIKERDYKRYNAWPGYIRKKVVVSWKSHYNKNAENKISIEDATALLKEQNYRCKHCNHNLECTFGSIKKRNVWGASLDRISVDVVGYGNGNGQWLCMSCNNGKCTMDNEEHLEKFAEKDRKIKDLEEKVERLTKLLSELGYKDAVQRLNGDGSNDSSA